MKKRLLSIISAVLALSLLAGCGSAAKDTEPDPVEGVLAGEELGVSDAADDIFSLNYNSSASLDPYATNDTNNLLISQLVFDNIFELSDDYELSSRIITSYSSENGSYWTFTVDTSIKMHDGTNLTASDVSYSIQRAKQTSRYSGRFTYTYGVSATSEDTFTAADGAAQRVDFMHKTEDRASYVRGEGYTVAQLSFRGGERMIFLLPDEGTALTPLLRGEAALADLFTDVYDSDEAQTAKLVWSVPKFDVNSDLELTDTLKMLGVTDAFDDTRADFSPLADFDEPAAVTQVQHAARVKIDEEGCEAAAFTAIMGDATSAMPEDLPVVEMNLNRPFAFAITGADGLPLFVGAVNTME